MCRLTEEEELALVLLKSQLQAEADKQLHFTEAFGKDRWLPQSACKGCDSEVMNSPMPCPCLLSVIRSCSPHDSP